MVRKNLQVKSYFERKKGNFWSKHQPIVFDIIQILFFHQAQIQNHFDFSEGQTI